MNFWKYSTFHNLVALQKPSLWVENSSREKAGVAARGLLDNLKFSNSKAASEIEQICLVVTADIFLGKVFECFLNSVSVRPTGLLTALRWTVEDDLVYQVAKRHGGEDGNHRDGAPAN